MSGSRSPQSGICDHCEKVAMVTCDTNHPQFQYCDKCYIDYVLPWLIEFMSIGEK